MVQKSINEIKCNGNLIFFIVWRLHFFVNLTISCYKFNKKEYSL